MELQKVRYDELRKSSGVLTPSGRSDELKEDISALDFGQ
jgi:hypothetical protein